MSQPPSAASVSISKTIWCTELKLEIAAQMVYDVRANLEAKYHGCSVCYMIAGQEEGGHISGDGCKTLPLSESTDGWKHFKDTMRFPPGIICWNCYLPTVRAI
jgi:hypothetical protein